MSVMSKVVAFVSGILFALGLGISGMTQPQKVLGFLDFAGAWDPTLIFVMGAAVAVHFFFAQKAKTWSAPFLAPRFVLPEKKKIDARLLVGAAIFGIGWGLLGYCPGPAVVSLAAGGIGAIVFVLCMLLGMRAVATLLLRTAGSSNRKT